jgi:uncharacterized protein (TIGR02246 family)
MYLNSVNGLVTGSSEAGIENVLNGFVESWNEHDAKKFSKVFTEDADCTNVMGDCFKGRFAIEEKHDPHFKTIWAHSILKITKSKIRHIKPDVAAVDAWWILEGLRTPDGNDRPPRNGLLNLIMTEHHGNWLITVMHNMDLPGSKSQNC